MSLPLFSGSRPQLKVLNNKIYLQKFNYFTQSSRKKVTFSYDNMKNFFSNEVEDFREIVKKTRDPNRFPQLVHKLQGDTEKKKTVHHRRFQSEGAPFMVKVAQSKNRRYGSD